MSFEHITAGAACASRAFVKSVGPLAEEPAVVSVPDQMAVELPFPPNAIGFLPWPEWSARAAKEIGAAAFPAHDGSAPPIRERDCRVGIHDALVAVRRKEIVVVVCVIVKKHPDLPEVIHAICHLSFGFGFRQSGQKHACQDRDDGDDYEQFDQCKRSLSATGGATDVQHLHIRCDAAAYPIRGVRVKN